MIVGIAGPSCSGKSTLSQRLAQEYSGYHISLDNFYIRGSPKEYVLHNGEHIRTFERPWLYDGEQLADIVETYLVQGEVTFSCYESITSDQKQQHHIQQPTPLILEGFQLLWFDRLRNIQDLSVYVDIPFEEQVRRRKVRGGRPKSDDNFVKIGEGEYEQYILPQKLHATHVVNGMKSSEALFLDVKELYEHHK